MANKINYKLKWPKEPLSTFMGYYFVHVLSWYLTDCVGDDSRVPKCEALSAIPAQLHMLCVMHVKRCFSMFLQVSCVFFRC